MSWFKLDDQFPNHPKIRKAGDSAAWLYVASGCYCAQYLTNGFFPKAVVPSLTSIRKPLEAAERLLTVGLWHDRDDEYEVHDYLLYNPTRESVLAEREKAAQRRANGGRASAERRATLVQASGGPVPVPDPDPVPHVLSEQEMSNGALELQSPAPPASAVGTVQPQILVDAVYEAWQNATGHHRAVLDPKRRRVIEAALKRYPVGDLIDACRGVVLFPHNRGETNGTRYDDLGLVLRDAEHIERFRDRYRGEDHPPVPRLPAGSDMTARNVARIEGRR